MNYCELVDRFNINELYSENPSGPIYLRPDINVPVNDKTGKISMDPPNLRLEYSAYVLERLAEFAPVVLIAHNGRKGNRDFVDFSDHVSILNTLTRKTRVYYERMVNGVPYFSRRLKTEVNDLQPGESLVIENIRMSFPYETKYTPDSAECQKMTSYFKECGIWKCVTEGGPLLHRDHWSNMEQPSIAKTYIGPLTAKEIKLTETVNEDSNKKIIIIGGSKPKINYLEGIAEHMDVGVVGLTSQYFLRINGYDLGEKNNNFVDMKMNKNLKEKDIDSIRQLSKKYEILVPETYKVEKDSDVKEIGLDELRKTDGFIVDIGDTTVGKYADVMNSGEYNWKIIAGSAGIYEQGYNNGAELIWETLGPNSIILGGDTIESLQEAKLCRPIQALDGKLCLMGGSALHRWARNPWYSLDRIKKMQMK